MATKSEKLRAFGLVQLQMCLWHWARQNKKIPFTFWKFIGSAARGALIGRVVAGVLGEANDTVNYTQYHRGKIVYCGITFDNRLNQRMAEHRRGGKIFDKVECSKPIARTDAFEVERTLIKMHKPKYNIQHNTPFTI